MTMTVDQLKYADDCIKILHDTYPRHCSLSDIETDLEYNEKKKIEGILESDGWFRRDNNMWHLQNDKLSILDIHVTYSAYYQYRLDEEDFRKQKDKLESENAKLTKTNLTLQNSQLRTKWVFSVTGFIIGAILTNLKDILELLKIIPPQ